MNWKVINNLWKTISKGYHGILLVIGTSRFFLFADFVFLYELVINPFFTDKKRIYPPLEITLLAILVVITSLWAASFNDGLQTGLRIFVLASILPTYKYGFRYKQVLGFTLGLLALFAIFQTMFMTRAIGIHFNAVMLGHSALVFMPIFWVEIGFISAIILTLSITRSSLVGLLVFSIFSQSRYFYYLAGFTVAIFIVFATISTPARLTFAGIQKDISLRITTISGFQESEIIEIYDDTCGTYRAVKWSWHGYGFGGFCEGTGQPRPHNMLVLSYYELGIFVIPFWGLIVYAGRRLNLVQVLPLVALGMVGDELIGRPEGVYLIAIWLISTKMMWSKSPHLKSEV